MTIALTADTTVSHRSSLLRTGAKAGVLAAGATTAIALVAQAVGVTFETAPGDAIPIAGFAQLTLFFTAVGVLIARSLRSRAQDPARTFVKTAVVLTALSVVPDLAMPFDAASKAALILTHVAAAVIVVPALAGRLAERD